MSVLVDEKSRIIVQGITGKEGKFHTYHCMDYASTQIVGGVTPGKGGSLFTEVPRKRSPFRYLTQFGSGCGDGANVSLIFVPPPYAADAIMEALDAGIHLIVAITEGVPIRDMVQVKQALLESEVSSDRSKLPGNHFAGKVQNRNHAWLYPQTG